MKLHVLYYCGTYGECTIFFGNNLTKPIDIIDGNDANWRHEYFDPVMAQVGVEVIRLSQDSFDDATLDAMVAEHYGY